MKRIAASLCIGLLAVLIGGCGPSAEQVATMTALAWTATPPPTPIPPSPTPVPYDLDASITDDSDTPIVGASIILPELGDGNPVLTNDQGQYSWKNLSTSAITLNVSGQGYKPAQQTATLARGPNQVKVVLQRDPAGLLASEACATGEKFLYAEDFQDGKAQDWNEIDLKTPGWDIVPAADDPQNMVASAQASDMAAEGAINSRLSNHVFDNGVWRMHFQVSKAITTNKTWFSFNWRHAPDQYELNGQQVFDSRYQIPLGYNYLALRRLQQPISNVGIGQVTNPKFGVWHLIEIGTYEGKTDLWVDGKRAMTYQDPQVIPPGSIGLELWLAGSDVKVYFDNISVCEMNAPFKSILATE